MLKGWQSLVCLILFANAQGTTLRVPYQFATIQSALDAVQGGDTVLVEVGVYSEALQLPPVSLVLLGNALPDTASYPRPILDPSSLPRSDTLSCLRLHDGGYAVTVEDFVFRNGPEMFPHGPYTGGGVYGSVSELTFRRCLFDSCDYGIYSFDADYVLEDCVFRDNPRGCIEVFSGSVCATACHFEGPGGFLVKSLSDNNCFIRCAFQCGQCGSFLEAGVRSIRDCTFGPGNTSMHPIFAGFRDGGEIAGNEFSDLTTLLNQTVLQVVHQSVEPVFIRGNTFRNLRTNDPFFPARTLVYENSVDQSSINCYIEENCFVDIMAGDGSESAKAILLLAGALITRNRFTDLGPRHGPPVIGTYTDAAVVHDNSFINTGLAVQQFDPEAIEILAQWNWWGDSTGPFHPVLNPGGLGVPVGDRVQFQPWHPDTLFWLVVAETPVVLPRSLALSAYPNPFNGAVRLRLEAPGAGEYRIGLYNSLGQEVRVLWTGAVNGAWEGVLDGRDLASGMYLVRAMPGGKGEAGETLRLLLVK